MKVTVTGGTGKLGQWLVRELLAPDDRGTAHEVTVLDRVSGPEQPGVRYLVGDVEDLGQVYGAIAGSDAVIHLAAVPRPGMVTENVTFRLKEPTNQYWNAVLVSGHRYPIRSVQVSINGTWTNASRQDYNYWLPPGGVMGTAPYQVRVTDVNGAVITASVALRSGDQASTQQFACQ